MNTIYKKLREEIIMKEVEKLRIEVIDAIDKEIDIVLSRIKNSFNSDNYEIKSMQKDDEDKLLELLNLRRSCNCIKEFKELDPVKIRPMTRRI